MPRIKRIYLEEGIFHILARGNNKQWLFEDKSDFKYYLDILKRLKKEQPFLLYHYILMNNHVHLLIETNQKTELSKLMKRINLLYYNHYRRKYNYAGHFWQDRFKSILVSKDEYLLACGLYIEGNPIRAGLVKIAEDYPYSSFKYNGERQKEYQKLILQGDNRISKQVLNNFFLGNKKFITEMERKFEVCNLRNRRGRPKDVEKNIK
jgi:putative transposase